MKIKYESQLRELRKLMDILNSWGNVLVNGNIPAMDRLQQVVDVIQLDGYSMEDIDKAIQELD